MRGVIIDHNAPHRPNVLDVVKAVTTVARDHTEVAVWWYVPRLLDNPTLELVLEAQPGSTIDCAWIAADVQAILVDLHVSARARRPDDEARRLYRVLSTSVPPVAGS